MNQIAGDACRGVVGRARKRVELRFELALIPFVIAVEQRDPIAACGGDSGIARRGRTLIALMAQQIDPALARRRHHIGRAIARRVVDHQDLVGCAALALHAGERASNLLSAIVERDDDRDRVAGSGHGASLL